MSSEPLHAGKSASFSLPSSLSEPDSTDARVARAGEAGLDRGAPPSNTAPHNSNNGFGSFRVLRLAVDSLYLSYPGDLSAAALATLKKLKQLAQSEHPEQQAEAQYPMGGHVFEVKDRGASRFPYVLADNAFRIQLSNPGKKLPMAYVQVSAEYLAHKGPVAVEAELQELLLEFCSTDAGWFGKNSVSRIDLAADFASTVSMESWHRNAWVTHATEVHSYAVDGAFTGWTVGLGGVIGCRLYDKVREIVHSGKCWVMNQWIPAGWEASEPVWRLEFEFKREFLKERSLSSLDTVLENLNGLWSYATTEWLRLTIPNEADATRSRWPIHPLWMQLASLDWQSLKGARLEKFSNERRPNDVRQITVLLGALSSYMASHGIDDRNEGVDALLRQMHEHYGLMASRKGLTFDELLARRVALKAREFNTALNAPGKVENLKDDYRREQEDNPYRRASRGE